MEKIAQIDRSALLFLNHLHNSFFDFIFYWASNRLVWIPLYAFLAILIYRKYPHRFFRILLAIAVLITLSDQLSSSVIKILVMRLRPCHDPVISADVHLVYGYCGGLYGFVSSHASNSFALTVFIWLLMGRSNRSLMILLFAWTMLVSYSRIYLGAHFPGDVLCGMALGGILAFLIFRLLQFIESRLLPVRSIQNS